MKSVTPFMGLVGREVILIKMGLEVKTRRFFFWVGGDGGGGVVVRGSS